MQIIRVSSNNLNESKSMNLFKESIDVRKHIEDENTAIKDAYNSGIVIAAAVGNVEEVMYR